MYKICNRIKNGQLLIFLRQKINEKKMARKRIFTYNITISGMKFDMSKADLSLTYTQS